MRRRLLWLLPPSLVLGLAATLAVSWFPNSLPRSTRPWSTARLWTGEAAGLTWSVAANEEHAMAWMNAQGFHSPQQAGEFHAKRAESFRGATGADFLEGFEWPSWSRFERLAPVVAAAAAKAGPKDALLTEYATGWPMRAFTGADWRPRDAEVRPVMRDHMIEIGSDFVPTKPLPLGVAVNTAFFSATAAVTLAAPFFIARIIKAARRHIRARRGLCPNCRYSRGGLAPEAPCPECGTSTAVAGAGGPDLRG